MESANSIRRLVLGFTPKDVNPEANTMPTDFDVKLQVCGEEVVLIYAGKPVEEGSSVSTRELPAGYRNFTKAKLIELLEFIYSN